MSGYFLYTFYGTEDELEDVMSQIDAMSGEDENYKLLTDMCLGISDNEKVEIKDPYKLEYGCSDDDCDISDIPFLFDDMMASLSSDFPDYEITGTGYSDDITSIPYWHKRRGTEEYVEEDANNYVGIVTMDDYDEDRDVFKFYSDNLNNIIEIPAEKIRGCGRTLKSSFSFEYEDENGVMMHGEYVTE